MCKSELNACFTKVLDPLNTNSPLTHGCVDSLLNSADVCSSKNVDVSGGSSSPVECCHDDMCNYRGLHDLTHPRGDSTGEIHKCDKNVLKDHPFAHPHVKVANLNAFLFFCGTKYFIEWTKRHFPQHLKTSHTGLEQHESELMTGF